MEEEGGGGGRQKSVWKVIYQSWDLWVFLPDGLCVLVVDHRRVSQRAPISKRRATCHEIKVYAVKKKC